MSEELFSTAERKSLDGFPEQIDLTAFWLAEDDRAHVAWRRSDPSRLAAGVQIGALRSLGFVPDDLTRVPKEAITVVSDQLGIAPGLLDEYRPTERTLRHNITMVERHLGFNRCDKGDLKAIGDWLVLRAMEHDRPLTLWGLVCDHLRSECLVRPAVVTLERLIANARREVNLIELLVEVNSWCGFLDQLTHAGNATTRSEHHNARLLAMVPHQFALCLVPRDSRWRV